MSENTTPLFSLETSTTIPLTPQVLADFRQLPPSLTERGLLEKRVKRLQDKIEGGRAIPFFWASAKLDGKEYRVNGQHSSEALSRMNGTLPGGLIVHRDIYAVKGQDGLILLFRQFDDRYSSRAPMDVAGAYLKSEPAIADLELEVVKRAAEGIAWYDSNIEATRKITGDDRYDLIQDSGVHPFFRWQNELFSSKTGELALLPVVAAMWATWQRNEAATKDFWDLVARGGVLGDQSDPSTQLDDALRDMREKKRPRVKPGEQYAGCIFAWNQWRSGLKPKSIRFDSSKGFVEPQE